MNDPRGAASATVLPGHRLESESTSWIGPRLLLVIGATGALAVAVALAREGPRRASGAETSDFAQYYCTGWRLDRGLPIYDPIRFDGDLAHQVGWSHENPLRTANPPTMACLTWPLARLPYPVAWWALCLGSIAMLSGGSWLAARHSGWCPVGAIAWALLAAGSLPTLAFVILNHIEAPVSLLGIVGWICLRHGRPYAGAVMWGLAASLKLFPAFWLVALMRWPNRGVALVGFAAAAGSGLVGMAAVGWDNSFAFLRDAFPQSDLWESDAANMSARSFSAALFGGRLGLPSSLVVATALLWAIFRGDGSADRLWCLGLCGSLLLSPLAWSYYLVFALPVASLVLAHLDLSTARGRMTFVLWISALFFWPSLLGRWMPGIEMAESWGWPWVLARHVPTIALAALAWAGHRWLRETVKNYPAADPVTPAAAAGS